MQLIAPALVASLVIALLISFVVHWVDNDAAADDANLNNECENGVCITTEAVLKHLAAFQGIAGGNGGTRVSSSPGYMESVLYVGNMLEDLGYNVTYQQFDYPEYYEETNQARLVQIAPTRKAYEHRQDFSTMFYSGSGDVITSVQSVNLSMDEPELSTSGCEPEDFSGFTPGNIALVQRGGCLFSTKVANAQEAGAAGVVLFNQGNAESRFGLFFGTVGASPVTIPVIATTHAVGVELANKDEPVTLEMFTNTSIETQSTFHVLAETPTGDENNVVMVGAHLDSVSVGPGINDNGSGVAAILEVAVQMIKVTPVNKVRFAFWGAEEAHVFGSDYYVFHLSDQEVDAIALYLNVDMIASPNFVYFVYNSTLDPEGSRDIEETFKIFYSSNGLGSEGIDLNGASDYAAFSASGIPVGGIFTGAKGDKTPDQAARFGGTAGEKYDPCYHATCDTLGNVNLEALETNAAAIAYATLRYAMSTESINQGQRRMRDFEQSKAARDAALAKFEYHGERLQR